MWIAGAIALVVAVGLAIGSVLTRRKLFAIQSTDTARAKDLQQLAGEVGAEIGGGAFRQRAEVKGRIVCDDPLVSELAKVPCVHYEMRVVQEYEETYWERNDKGDNVRRTRRGSETVAHNARSVPFVVEDESGRVEVDPTGADLVTEKVCSRFDPEPPSENALKLGGLSVSWGGGIPTTGRRVLGLSYEEEAIPVGRDIYVLGEASDRSGRLRVEKPEDGGHFLVSLKSEEQLVASARSKATGLAVAAALVGLIGVGLVVYDLVR